MVDRSRIFPRKPNCQFSRKRIRSALGVKRAEVSAASTLGHDVVHEFVHFRRIQKFDVRSECPPCVRHAATFVLLRELLEQDLEFVLRYLGESSEYVLRTVALESDEIARKP